MRKLLILGGIFLLAAAAPAEAVQLKSSSGARVSAPVSRGGMTIYTRPTSPFNAPLRPPTVTPRLNSTPVKVWTAPIGSRNAAGGIYTSPSGQRMGIGNTAR